MPLTIIIGTICDNGKKAIAISDKMITAENLSIEFEHKSPKLEQIGNNCVLLSAGSALNPTEVFEQVKSKYARQHYTQVNDILKDVKKNYVEVRNRKAEEELFYPVSMTIQNFQQNQNVMNENIVLRLDRALAEYDLGLAILLVGVDSSGAHIHTISNPGISYSYDVLGFCCVGSGERHAYDSLIVNKYNQEVPFKQALFAAYEAKKKSEVAPGVGNETDMLYIDETGIHPIEESDMRQLQNIYDEKSKLYQPMDKKIADLINTLELNK